MPDFLMPLRERAAAHSPDFRPSDWRTRSSPNTGRGTSIGWHRDRPHYDDVIGISLSSPSTFRMREGTTELGARVAAARSPLSYLMRGQLRGQGAQHSAVDSCATRYVSIMRAELGGRRAIRDVSNTRTAAPSAPPFSPIVALVVRRVAVMRNIRILPLPIAGRLRHSLMMRSAGGTARTPDFVIIAAMPRALARAIKSNFGLFDFIVRSFVNLSRRFTYCGLCAAQERAA